MEHYPYKSWIPLARQLESKFGTKQLFQKVSFPNAKKITNITTRSSSSSSRYINSFCVAQSQGIHGCSLRFPNKSHNHPTAQQNATFCGPARQMGACAAGLGTFAMRMGRVAVPVVRKYIVPVAKHIGKNLLEAAIPEIG